MPSPSARRATSRPMRPRPRMPRVLPASSMPAKRERSQFPALRAPCACGTFRASASMRAIVCSAADTTVESGAFATTIPRLVAASTSTLSTPTPARPMTLSRSARSISEASIVVAERITMASKPSMIDARSVSPSSTTVNRLRRSSSPGSAIGSRTRTRGRSGSSSSDTDGLPVRVERTRDRRSTLDLRTPLCEQDLDRGEGGRDVEHVVVADVADAEHPLA